MILMPIIGLLLIFGSTSLVDPVYPPLALSGGTVVAELHLAGGKVEAINILSGGEPFVGSCKSALAQWNLPSERDGDVMVVVHFRHQNLYNYANSEEQIDCRKPNKSLPYPKRITAPTYPAQVLAQGSVVLKADISAEGGVSDVSVMKSLGSLTDLGSDAVRKWVFVPAEDRQGNAKPSSIYAVLVFRFPVIAPER
jgi:hypothetical protein